MLPIYVSYDSGVDRVEIDAIDEAIEEVKSLFPRRRIIDYQSATWRAGDFSSANWYIKEAKKRDKSYVPGSPINAFWLLNLVSQEPFQKVNEHIDVLFTSEDLTAPEQSICHGLGSDRYTVQSVYRYRNLPVEDRRLMIKYTFYHEIGHVLGCARNLNRSNTEDRYGHHCTRYGCVMRQGLTPGARLQIAKEASKMGRIFCPQCQEDARHSKI